MKCTVIIVTLDRPECVRRCIQCLHAQELAVAQIVVVDASRGMETRSVCAEFPDVLYLHHEFGEAKTTYARNLGLKHSTGDIIAFLDDDSFARPCWLGSLVTTYGNDFRIGAVGGRALRSTPNEESEGLERIGRLTRDGSLTGFFGADPGKVIEVDHLIGCNMSFRREVVARLGGFRSGFETRYCIREESDIFVVMKKYGYRILFNPAAVVDHVGAPKPTGKRFDVSWDYFGHRNHYVLLMRNFGICAGIVWRHFGTSLFRALGVFVRDCGKASIRLWAVLAGTFSGLLAGTFYTLKQGDDPVRRDGEGLQISKHLLSCAPSVPVEACSESESHVFRCPAKLDTVG